MIFCIVYSSESIDDEVNELHIANVVINTETNKFFLLFFCIDVIIM